MSLAGNDKPQSAEQILEALGRLDHEYQSLDEKEQILHDALHRIKLEAVCLKRAIQEANTNANTTTTNQRKQQKPPTVAKKPPPPPPATEIDREEAARRLEQALLEDNSTSDEDDDINDVDDNQQKQPAVPAVAAATQGMRTKKRQPCNKN